MSLGFLNKLTISHSDEDAMRFFVDSYNNGCACSAFIRMPKRVFIQYAKWDQWKTKNWGTKEDVGVHEGENGEIYNWEAIVSRKKVGDAQIMEAVCVFFSCDSPPVKLYEELLARGFSVRTVSFSLDDERCVFVSDCGTQETQKLFAWS
jgi:hypothetical protein